MNAIRLAWLASVLLLALSGSSVAQCLRQVLERPDNGIAYDTFGLGFAIQGTTLLVGCPTGVLPLGGACYAFEEISDVWELSTDLRPSDGLSYSWFGGVLALDGDRALIGARFTDAVAQNAGAAFVFERSGGTWTQSARLSPALLEAGDIFGVEVAFNQGRAFVGAPRDDDGGFDSGAIYVFEEVAGTWVETDKLVAQSVAGLGEFGSSLTIQGDHMLVGAPRSAAGGVDRGAVVAYQRQGGSWIESGTLALTGIIDNSVIGFDVLIHGQRAFVSAKSEEGGVQLGRVHVFEQVAGAWVEEEVLQLPNQESPGGLGTFAAAGERLLVGAPSAELGNGGSGAAYLFRRTPSGYMVEAELTFPGSFHFGSEVALPNTLRALVAAPATNFSLSSGVYSFDLSRYASSACLCSSTAPCENWDEIAGCRNSTGHGARLSACGGASVASDTLELRARKVPMNQPAMLFASSESRPPSRALPLGDGLLCGAGTIRRLTIKTSDPNGELTWGPGLGSTGGWSPGETWSFHVWYRDPAGPCASGSNTSAAVQVRFAP